MCKANQHRAKACYHGNMVDSITGYRAISFEPSHLCVVTQFNQLSSLEQQPANQGWGWKVGVVSPCACTGDVLCLRFSHR